ncbi:MAG TPA: sulfotransferase [Chloroflexota bacterium]|nr:sulfotransferase [Chloroflexota bacterium]
MKVIGAGVARTGTTSTKAALEELGFGPCYTFFTMFSRPADVDRWLAAYAGEPIDWSQFLGEFESTVDWPACDFYEQLMALYPEAPVVLTVREAEGWYRSMFNTIWDVHQAEVAAGRGPETDGMSRLREVMMWQGAFDGRFLDKQHAINFFERHIQQVKKRVPADRLLVFDAKDGWEPLCRFLGVAVPDRPFPRLNDTAAFNERVQQMRASTDRPQSQH